MKNVTFSLGKICSPLQFHKKNVSFACCANGTNAKLVKLVILKVESSVFHLPSAMECLLLFYRVNIVTSLDVLHRRRLSVFLRYVT